MDRAGRLEKGPRLPEPPLLDALRRDYTRACGLAKGESPNEWSIPLAPGGAVIAYGPSRVPGVRGFYSQPSLAVQNRLTKLGRARPLVTVPELMSCELRRRPETVTTTPRRQHRNVRFPEFQMVLDLILKDGQLNVHAGEVEVRPPPAPTTRALASDRL